MFRIANLVGVLSLVGAVSVIPLDEGAAQQPYDYVSVVYEAARNKIGLMRYCRNNALLRVSVAEEAAAAVRFVLLKMALGTAHAKEKGDIAENAGEDGFWEASRRHDMAGIARRFGTTPAGLCSEWAQETLRTLQPDGVHDAMAVSPVQPPRTFHNVNRPRVMVGHKVPKTSHKPPMPAKAAAVSAKVAVAEVTKAPVEPAREEPTVNWATGPIVVWTSTVRTQARPPRE